MELQDTTIKVRAMVESLIRHCIDPQYKFTQSGNVALQLQTGLELLPALFKMSGIDDERIVDYIVYQVYRNRDCIAEGRWNPVWLFSQNALDKYRNQFLSADGKQGMNYYINQWLNEHDLSRGTLTSMIAKPKPNPLRKMVYLESEESIKRRFYNTIEGLALCSQSTTGWSPFSAACNECKYRKECEKTTTNKYPELIRIRKEEYGKKK